MLRLLPKNALVWLLLFILLVPYTATAQVLSPAAAAAPAPAKTDPLKRTTPRSAVYGLLQACHAGNFDQAAQYLDLRRIRSDQRARQGADLAKQLGIVLDRDSHFEILHLSDDPAGRVGDGLPPNLDRLNDFELNQQTIYLNMQREDIDGQQLWLVSADSVARIPQLAAAIEESPIEKKLPAPLVTIRFLGTPLWIWLALLLSALLVAGISGLLARLFLAIIRPIAHRYSQLHVHRLEGFVPSLRLLLSVALFRTCMEFIGPSALLRDALIKLLALLFVGGVASIIMHIVDAISDTVASRLNVRQRALSYSVLPLIARSVKIVIGFLAILTILGSWGYNVNAVLAGLGVGGIAVALAAQKTIENLFGGISVITDKPVLVGDFCNYGGQVGTVEDIGLRSTRIRTLDRSVVTIPNSSFSTMTLENLSKRDRMWFHPTLNLHRDSTAEQIRAMMDAITEILKSHPKVDPTDIPLRFTKISKESFDLEIFSYVNSDDYNVYLEVQTELLLGIVEAAKRLKVEFAVPIQETLLPHPANFIASNKAPSAGE